MIDIRKDYAKEFEDKELFGMLTTIDAKSCNDFVLQEDKIRLFTLALCEVIGMKRYGECELVHFGDEPKVSGYSTKQRGCGDVNQMTQLIETSLISGHFVDNSQDAYIDVFSCKCYDPYHVRDFVKLFFKPSQLIMNVTNRG